MPTTELTTLLAPAATHARRMMVRIARNAYGLHDEPINREEYGLFSLTAAFDAFLDLGGNPNEPARFDWTAQQVELRGRTARHLGRRIRAEVEGDNDVVKRARCRRDAAHVEEYKWDAWQDTEPTRGASTRSAAESAVSGHESIVAEVPDCAPQQERMLEEQELQGLGAELAHILSAADLELITRHYFHGVSQIDLAAELAKTRGSTLKQAETAINVRMHRARSRLRTKLSHRWHDLARGL